MAIIHAKTDKLKAKEENILKIAAQLSETFQSLFLKRIKQLIARNDEAIKQLQTQVKPEYFENIQDYQQALEERQLGWVADIMAEVLELLTEFYNLHVQPQLTNILKTNDQNILMIIISSQLSGIIEEQAGIYRDRITHLWAIVLDREYYQDT